MKTWLGALALIGSAALGHADAEAALELSGNLDAKFGLIQARTGSPAYRLGLGKAPLSQPLTQFTLEPYVNADYATSQAGFHAKGHGLVDDDTDADFDLLELYGTLSPSFNWSASAGKKAFNWGRGYAFNPVGFINPAKDPQNPEQPQSGRLALALEYTKSLEGPALSALSLLGVLLPPERTVNGVGEAQATGAAVKGGALLWDTDIDLMGLDRGPGERRLGLALSRNLSTNLELHGEYGALWAQAEPAEASGLAGFRYLNSLNTTVIAEYYRAGSGRDYAYAKLSQPEPFGWVHFTPSLSAIVNLQDGSFSASAPQSYKPFTNTEIIFWPSVFIGPEGSEFGSKAFEQRYDVWLRFYFG